MVWCIAWLVCFGVGTWYVIGGIGGVTLFWVTLGACVVCTLGSCEMMGAFRCFLFVYVPVVRKCCLVTELLGTGHRLVLQRESWLGVLVVRQPESWLLRLRHQEVTQRATRNCVEKNPKCLPCVQISCLGHRGSGTGSVPLPGQYTTYRSP